MKMYNLRTISTLVFSFFLSQAIIASCIYEQLLQGENLPIGTMLTWSTSYEENNVMFIIEKSDDGKTFAEVGNVNASGDSDEIKDYNFLDVMSNAAKSYYRLKQVDTDGTFSFSEILIIQQKFANNFMVARMSAVATTDMFEVTIDAMKDGDLTYNLANWKGEVVLEDKMIIINGLNDLTVDMTDQKQGIYKLNLSMEDELETLVLKKVPDEIKQKSNMASKNKMEKGKN